MAFLVAWIDVGPLFFLIGLIVVGLIVLMARRGRSLRSVGLPALLLYLAAFWFVFYGPFVERERLMTFPMTWKKGEPGEHGSKMTHLVLEFRDHPGYVQGIMSDDLAAYLEGRGSNDVDVTLEVMTTWGHTQGTRVVKIGDLTSWKFDGGYSGWSGTGKMQPGPSPFP